MTLSQQIIEKIENIKNGYQVAPLCVSSRQAHEIYGYIFGEQVENIDLGEGKENMDFFYYDCADKKSENHKIENIRAFLQKLGKTPGNTIMLALIYRIEALTEKSANALLQIFENTPQKLCILVVSFSPQKIIPTLRSRMIFLNENSHHEIDVNPLQSVVDSYVSGNPEPIFQMTLASSKESPFPREDALWIVKGLQDAIEYGKLSPGFAKEVSQTRYLLETTNTLPRYLIDQLLISIQCAT